MIDIYSKRQKKLRGEVPDVYRYDELPRPLRVQIVHILTAAIGRPVQYVRAPEEVFEYVCQTLCEEYGEFRLMKERGSAREHVCNFFLSERDIDKCLDVVELIFRCVEKIVRENLDGFPNAEKPPDLAIEELNYRLNEHGVGYQYANSQIIRVDSALIHKEVVLPTLVFLREPHLTGANQEFLSAHEHYRHGKYKECLVDCLKSFESTMKAICHKRRWTYDEKDTAKTLIAICEKNGLFPVFLESHLTGLRTTLESGVPTARNRKGAHGQGTTPTDVAPEFAAYVLHLTAANILFLASAEKRLK